MPVEELPPPPLPDELSEEKKPDEDEDAWAREDEGPAIDPEYAEALLGSKGVVRKKKTDPPLPQRNERYAATGSIFLGGTIVEDSFGRGSSSGSGPSGGLRAGIRYFPTRGKWSAAGMMELSFGLTGLEVGIPLRLELNYIPDKLGTKLPTARIGAVAHPFVSTGGVISGRHGVRLGAVFGWSALVGLATLDQSTTLAVVGAGILICLLALPVAGPLVAIGLTGLGLLLASPDIVVGFEVGRDSVIGSYRASFFSIGIGI